LFYGKILSYLGVDSKKHEM